MESSVAKASSEYRKALIRGEWTATQRLLAAIAFYEAAQRRNAQTAKAERLILAGEGALLLATFWASLAGAPWLVTLALLSASMGGIVLCFAAERSAEEAAALLRFAASEYDTANCLFEEEAREILRRAFGTP